MATQSPFYGPLSLLDGFFRASSFSMPPWLMAELSHRLVLLLNHVLMQEKAACERLMRQKGQVVLVKWRSMGIKLVATPAGLLDVADAGASPSLTLVLTQDSPFEITQTVLKGDKPVVRIEGDVQLAAEINWLIDHVRWDAEEDLARLLGDVPAHRLLQVAAQAVQALRGFAAQTYGSAAGAGATSYASP